MKAFLSWTLASLERLELSFDWTIASILRQKIR